MSFFATVNVHLSLDETYADITPLRMNENSPCAFMLVLFVQHYVFFLVWHPNTVLSCGVVIICVAFALFLSHEVESVAVLCHQYLRK